MHDLYAHSRDILADDAISIKSFDTILPSYSEATAPPYTPGPAPPPQPPTINSSRSRVNRPPPVPNPQILSISQSNLPLRFNGPQSSVSHPWQPKIVYPSSSVKRRKPGAELNIFFRNNKPPTEALAHGDTCEVPGLARRGSSSRTPTGRSFEEEARMRELDALTRRISRQAQSTSDYPRAVPQIAGSLRRESRLLGGEWDNLAVETQREEIIVRISELESQFQEQRQLPQNDFKSLRGEVASLQTILAARRDDVSGILASQVAKLRELKEAGTKVSHVQKNQIKIDMLSMKGEISFLDQRAADLEQFLRLVENCAALDGALEDDSKNWDLYFEAARHR